MSLISRNEIIIKYQITGGQINYLVNKRLFPKRALIKKHNEVFYDADEIKDYFKKNPVKPSKRSTPKVRDRRNIFSSNIPESKQSKENKRIASFNRLAVTFNIQKREREKKRKIAMHSLYNKYKPIKQYHVELQDIHEHAEIRYIDVMSQINNLNHILNI